MPLLEQQHPDMAEKRVSDGSDGLPPISKSRRRKGKGKNASLQTTSVPLTPEASCALSSSSHFDLQQATRLSLTSDRAPVVRRSTVSDAGQVADCFQDVALQLAPSLDLLDRSPASSSKSVDHSTAGAADAAAVDAGSLAGAQQKKHGLYSFFKQCRAMHAMHGEMRTSSPPWFGKQHVLAYSDSCTPAKATAAQSCP
jgi:hypothetical protein